MARTLLLGLDGATFTLLDPLMEQGVMPFLREFTRNGCRAELMSTPCPVTPPAWTTVMTGRSPGHHGIYDFIHTDDRIGDHVAFRLINGRDVQVETAWSVAGRQGRTAGVLNFPASYQLPPFNGYVVPGFVTSRLLRSGTQPREFYDRLKSLPGFHVKDAAWDLGEGRKPLGRGLEERQDFLDWIAYLSRKETSWAAITHELIVGTPCDLIAVIFEGVDRLQHQAWHLLDPACVPADLNDWDRQLRDAALGYYRGLDDLLRQLVEAAGENARTLIVSDHGFGPTTEVFYANVWLEQNGYLAWRPSAQADHEDMLTAHNMREHFETIDWNRTLAYARTTSANGIYIRVAEQPGDVGVKPEEYDAFRAELARKLLEWQDPRTNTPVVTRALTREQVFAGPHSRHAPDLTLVLRDGGFISILKAPVVVKQRDEVKGTHRPAGVLIAGGKGVRSGATVEPVSLLDVAPTLLHSIELPVPSDLEGCVATELFEPAFLGSHPVRYGPATIDPDIVVPANGDDAADAANERAILERLKALGYME